MTRTRSDNHACATGVAGPSRDIQKQLYAVMQRTLIVFQRQRVVSHLLHHLLGCLALAMHGASGNHLAPQGQHFQQLGFCGNLLGFAGGGQLPQHQSLLISPSPDQLQG